MWEVNVEFWGGAGLEVCAIKWILWIGLRPKFRHFPAGQKQNAKSLHWYMDPTCETDIIWFQSSKFSEGKLWLEWKEVLINIFPLFSPKVVLSMNYPEQARTDAVHFTVSGCNHKSQNCNRKSKHLLQCCNKWDFVQFTYMYILIGSLCQYIILIMYLLMRITIEDWKLLSVEDENQTKSVGCPVCNLWSWFWEFQVLWGSAERTYNLCICNLTVLELDSGKLIHEKREGV